jgi:hypothetical protein
VSFHNARSTGPADGIEKNYQGIPTLLDRMYIEHNNVVVRSSESYLANQNTPSDSAKHPIKVITNRYCIVITWDRRRLVCSKRASRPHSCKHWSYGEESPQMIFRNMQTSTSKR